MNRCAKIIVSSVSAFLHDNLFPFWPSPQPLKVGDSFFIINIWQLN